MKIFVSSEGKGDFFYHEIAKLEIDHGGSGDVRWHAHEGGQDRYFTIHLNGLYSVNASMSRSELFDAFTKACREMDGAEILNQLSEAERRLSALDNSYPANDED
jgi:hypothetical protein